MSIAVKHPDYPPERLSDDAMDRCRCGGVRYWHAKEPYGCDDCPCEAFEAVKGREKRFDRPVIVVESNTDPGDMGEPREFWDDEAKADVLIVPSARLWAPTVWLADTDGRHTHGYAIIDGEVEKVARCRGGYGHPESRVQGPDGACPACRRAAR